MMAIRILSLILGAALLSACAGADFPGFVDSTYEATTGVNLEDTMIERPNQVDEAYLPEEVAPEPEEEPLVTPDYAFSLYDLLEFYADWSVLLVAADYRAASGAPTDAFDNARSAMAENLARLGFEPSNMVHLSVRPELYGDERIHDASYDNMRVDFREARRQAGDGCLVYLTSHGGPAGLSLGETGVLPPEQLDDFLDILCGTDPTIVIVSACYSGIFASGDMLESNRFIMTASRSDRSSFGCGEGIQYPYFDACIFETFPHAGDWLDLARSTRTCVETRERAEGLSPPSAPQIYVGPDVRDTVLNPFLSLGYETPTGS